MVETTFRKKSSTKKFSGLVLKIGVLHASDNFYFLSEGHFPPFLCGLLQGHDHHDDTRYIILKNIETHAAAGSLLVPRFRTELHPWESQIAFQIETNATYMKY